MFGIGYQESRIVLVILLILFGASRLRSLPAHSAKTVWVPKEY